jgi:hypothetical protein
MKQIVQPGRIPIRRANSLGQLDREFNYGPQPLHPRDIPIDLRNRFIRPGMGGTPGAVDPTTGLPAPGTPDFDQLIRDVHEIAGTVVLRRGLLGRVETITSSPQLIIEQREKDGRGYLLLNPAGVVGLTASGTIFSTQTVVGAATVTSGTLGVANYKNGSFFIVATFNAGAGPVTFDLQTADPVTGTFITSQTISLTATGNTYVNVGNLGIDVDFQVFVTVPVGTSITFSMGFVLKDGLDGTSTGASQTIFIGGAGVSPVSGYPLLSGKEKPFFLEENVLLYAVTSGPNLDMNIFEL